MGKRRKSTKKVVTKRKDVVPKSFKCPFCSHEGSCEVKMNHDTQTGTITCRICGENFQSRINFLSDPIDVYCEWIDAADKARDGGIDAI